MKASTSMVPGHLTTRKKRRVMLVIGLGLLLVAAIAGWVAHVLFGPGPLEFAGERVVVLEQERADDPTGVPPDLKSASEIERGKYLARAADCVVCHTAPNGRPYEGGRAFTLPFGTLYSTNITPDTETGIGRYSDEQFLDAVHRGIRRDMRKLYPAMPYPSYSYMSDADVLAIKAYLFSLAPLDAPARPSTLGFPFDQRSLMAFWNVFFSPDKRYQINVGHDAQWNRGAYVAEALGHCGECHTPRTAFFSLDNRKKFGGEIQDGWHAFNITPSARSGIASWRQSELVSYLSTGEAPGHGSASGPMGEVVAESLSHLAPSDIEALATYVRSVRPVQDDGPAPIVFASRGSPPSLRARGDAGALIFAQSCAGCHGWDGENASLQLSRLIGNRTVSDPKATNVVRIVLDGGTRHPGERTSVMPAFGETYNNAEIAALAQFVVAQFGSTEATVTAEDVEQARHLASQDAGIDETRATATR